MKRLVYNAPTMQAHRLLSHPIMQASGTHTQTVTFTTETEESWENADEVGINN